MAVAVQGGRGKAVGADGRQGRRREEAGLGRGGRGSLPWRARREGQKGPVAARLSVEIVFAAVSTSCMLAFWARGKCSRLCRRQKLLLLFVVVVVFAWASICTTNCTALPCAALLCTTGVVYYCPFCRDLGILNTFFLPLP